MLYKDSSEIKLIKSADTVKVLEDLVENSSQDSVVDKPEAFCVGIAHTHWPTMGFLRTVNMHPFISND
jgi:glucosamine 6-phosphate synthetase-like amidotransferase/phosphosugar isomerase protein